MLRVINALCFFIPIFIIIYNYLNIKVCIYKKKYTNISRYYDNYENSRFFILAGGIVIFLICTIGNIIYISTAYYYELIRHYCSYTYVVASISVIILGNIILEVKLDYNELYYVIKANKLQKKIEKIEERIKYVESMNVSLSREILFRDETLEVLRKNKGDCLKELIYLNTYWIVDYEDREKLKNKKNK